MTLKPSVDGSKEDVGIDTIPDGTGEKLGTGLAITGDSLREGSGEGTEGEDEIVEDEEDGVSEGKSASVGPFDNAKGALDGIATGSFVGIPPNVGKFDEVGNAVKGESVIEGRGDVDGMLVTSSFDTAKKAPFPLLFSQIQSLKLTSPFAPLYIIDAFCASRNVNPDIITPVGPPAITI